MSALPAGRIVVGVDGSDHADQAVRWAATLASAERRPLVLLHAGVPEQAEDHPAARAAEVAHAVDPALRIVPVSSPEEPRRALLDASTGAEVLVLGSRGLGPLRSLVLGSTSQAVARSAGCPTAVVRRHPVSGAHGVVVGIDGTADSDGALRFAARMASAWREPLLVVHCYWDRSGDEHRTGAVGTVDEQRVLVAEQLAGLAEVHPDVATRTVLARGFADQHLLRESVGARLLVVGHRPVSPLRELVWGTLAPTVLEHAVSDVVVVPAPPA